MLVAAYLVAAADQVTAFTAHPIGDWLLPFDPSDTFRTYGSIFGQDLPVAPYFFLDVMLLSVAAIAAGLVVNRLYLPDLFRYIVPVTCTPREASSGPVASPVIGTL